LIGLGAKTIVVPGVIPMGCVPRYLTIFQSNDPDDYDAAGCIRWLNDFAEEHNRALRRMLDHVRPRDPTVAVVVYADYYGAILEITRSPQKHGMHGGSYRRRRFNCMLRITIQSRFAHANAGFRKDVALTACCGDGGPHNSGKIIACNATSILCPDPSRHISWDGIHLTEAAYQFVARGVLDGPYAAPSSILSKCRR
jgi:lysophospholipase L1-like esterase